MKFILLSVTLLVVRANAALDCRCKIPKMVPRIKGGWEATPNDYPWMVSLGNRYGFGSRHQHFCGGAILNKRWILTAAHCVRSKSAYSIAILVGAHSLIGNPSSRIYAAQKIVINPSYSRDRYHINDIALIQLNRDIEMSETIQPACVSSTDFNYKSFTLTGWGRFGRFQRSPNELHEVDLKFVDNQKCANSWSDFFRFNSKQVVANAICAIDVGKDGCNGDSGGPLMSAQNGKMYVVGVVSKGYFCTTHKPTIFEKVSARMSWISSNAGETCN